MSELELLTTRAGFTSATFTVRNRLRRVCWQAAWLLLARWTPAPLHKWRVLLLRAFGGDVDWSAHVYSDVMVWAPWNLSIRAYGTLARGVICYNIARIAIGERAVVSQRAHLCTGTHDYSDPAFPLYARPIDIGRRAWVCADAFVGPGVAVGDGAVLAAAGVAFNNLESWSVNVGNPAVMRKKRPPIVDEQ